MRNVLGLLAYSGAIFGITMATLAASAQELASGPSACRSAGMITVSAGTDHWVTGISITDGQSIHLQVKARSVTVPQTWGVIDPPRRGQQAAWGNEIVARGRYMVNNIAHEGALLVRHNGGQPQAFAQAGPNDWNTKIITFSGAGNVDFVANDEGPNDSHPIPLGRGPVRAGWRDNVGSLDLSFVLDGCPRTAPQTRGAPTEALPRPAQQATITALNNTSRTLYVFHATTKGSATTVRCEQLSGGESVAGRSQWQMSLATDEIAWIRLMETPRERCDSRYEKGYFWAAGRNGNQVFSVN